MENKTVKTLWNKHQAMASPRIGVLASHSSVGQVSNCQTEPTVRKEGDLYVEHWGV